jgi:hypothetical protein
LLGCGQLGFGGGDTGLSKIQGVLSGLGAPFSKAELFKRVSAKGLGASFDLPRVVLQITDNLSRLVD